MATSSISSGQTSGGLTVSGGETLEVLAGGRINAGTVDSGGIVYVQAGGSASATVIASGGTEYVSGGTAVGTLLGSGGAQYVTAGGVASATTVGSGGAQYVSGGSAFSTVLSSGGFQFVGSGGLASGTLLGVYAYEFVSSGGVASATTATSGGIVYVTGGSAVGTTLDAGGDEYVVSGGLASATVVLAGAVFVSAGGVASAATIDSGGTLFLSAGSAFAAVVSSGGAEAIGSGGIERNADVLASGLEVVSAGGIASHTSVAVGGAALVLSGGSAVSTSVASGGVLVVLGGGHASSGTVATGGTVISAAVALRLPHGVSAWAASASGVAVGGGDTLYVVTGGLASAIALSGGAEIVQGGTAIAAGVSAGGTERVRGGGVVSGSIVGAGGVEFVSSGGLALAGRVTNGGLALVSSGGNLSAATIGAGGSAVISQGGRAGGVTVAGGALVLNSGASAYGSLAFSGFGGVLAIGGTAMPTVPISGFSAGDTIDLPNIASFTATLNSGTDVLALFGGGATYDLQLAGSFVGTVLHTGSDGAGGGIVDIPCFAAGTRIATARGELPVEALAPGDLVRTAAGTLRPVRWIGRRRVACSRHPHPADVQPVRIVAGAFAPGQPRRDLWLSPDHAVFCGGVLIPVRYLVNGRTVAPVPVESIEYLHVELDRHDVLLAEELPVESFLDTGNRGAFADAGVTALHPDFALRVWQAEGCAELVTAGKKLADARRGLLARAASLGHRLSPDPMVAVVAEGRRLAAAIEGATWCVRLDQPAARLALRSRVWIPAQTDSEATDTRALGVAIGRLALDGRAVPLTSPLLSGGWHAPEAEWRWTGGAAELYVAGVRELCFTLAMGGRYWSSDRGRRPGRVARAASG